MFGWSGPTANDPPFGKWYVARCPTSILAWRGTTAVEMRGSVATRTVCKPPQEWPVAGAFRISQIRVVVSNMVDNPAGGQRCRQARASCHAVSRTNAHGTVATTALSAGGHMAVLAALQLARPLLRFRAA